MNRSLSLAAPRLLMFVAGLVMALVALPTLADPPARAARISFVAGNASFSPAGSDDWLQARINRPIWIGDRLWSGDGRVELQLGGASLRLAPRTALQVLNFDDRIAQFEVTQGSVALHVRAIDRNDTIEIDTPSFAFVTHEVGDYRIDVEPDRTAVSTRRGFGDIYGHNVAYRIDRREQFAFYTPDLRDYDVGPLPPPDALDRWARERARREDQSISARYVAPQLVGFVDLDEHGEWRVDATYGNVWIPRVPANWAPYRYGHWTWIDPWGWTWVDDAPWGFAPSHYGRWTRLGASWAWVPGPRNVRPVYAPALVAWVGGDISLSVSTGRTRGVGWFPLAPGEIWRPSYDVSRDYFTRVNVSNTVVNSTTVVNVYNTRNDVRVANVDYRFRAAPQAVTAVPVETFVQSRPVQLTASQMAANAAAQANVLVAPTVQPSVQSIVGAGAPAQARPPAETVRRSVVARTAPAAALPSIEQRAAMVKEGKPVDREALERAAPQAAQPAPQRPATAAPGAAQPPAAQAPSGTIAPRELRANVRVSEAEKATPKPLPPASPQGARAGRDDAGKGRPAEGAPASAPQAGTPAPQASQPPPTPRAAQPASGPTAAQPAPAPQAEPPAQPRRPEVAAPPAAAQPQPGSAPAPTPPREAASPPGRNADERPNRPTPGPDRQREAAQPATPSAPVPPAPRAPGGRAADADPPNVDQLRGRDADRRGPPSERPGGPRDERRAQPAQVTPAPTAPAQVAPTQQTPPSAPPARPRVEEARPPAPAAAPPQAQPAPPVPGARQQQAEEPRRAAPAAPTPPAKASEAAPKPAPQAAPPAPPPAPAAARPTPPGKADDAKRDDREAEREKGKDRGKDGKRDKDRD